MKFALAIQKVMDQVHHLRDHVDDHWQIPQEEALVLAQLVRIGHSRSICEIGTSYGYSTLHLAAAVHENGGHMHTIDIDPKKNQAAADHLAQAGLTDAVTFHLGDARQLLLDLKPEHPFDFVFIDAVKDQSRDYYLAIERLLAPTCVIVTDNTRTHPDELEEFVHFLRQRPEIVGCDVPVGNGFELSLRRSVKG